MHTALPRLWLLALQTSHHSLSCLRSVMRGRCVPVQYHTLAHSAQQGMQAPQTKAAYSKANERTDGRSPADCSSVPCWQEGVGCSLIKRILRGTQAQNPSSVQYEL